MKKKNLYVICSFIFILLSQAESSAQTDWRTDTLINPIPTQRALFTGRVEEIIDEIDKRDGKIDKHVVFRDEKSSKRVTQVLIVDAYQIMVMIENMSIDQSRKITYHRNLETVLRRLHNSNWLEKEVSYFEENMKVIREAIIADANNSLIEYAKKSKSLNALNIIEIFENKDANKIIYEKISKSDPFALLERLPKIVNEPYADNVITAIAPLSPSTILTYAQSTSNLSGLVRRNNDPLVKTIVAIADQSKNTLKVLPFLGLIARGEKTIKEIDAIANNNDKYLQALVDLIVADEQMGRKDIETELNRRCMWYINEINRLHDSPDNVRFASIQNFRDVDYYAMIIGGQDEIYTSSYTRGPFALMLKKMDKKSGKKLLDELHDYHFRTFIRLAAGFNRLTDFLGTMTNEERSTVLKNFVSDLEAGDEYDLTNAVDVADAYGSLKDTFLIQFLKNEVVSNYERVKKSRNEKGIIVYGLLGTIFNETEKKEKAGDGLSYIPPITYLPYTSLKVNDSVGVVEQMFFYGDDDGKRAFNSFLSFMKADKNWTFQDNKYWVKFTYKGQNKMTIFANKPLDYDSGEDEIAQKELRKHMDENDITPTVFVHRGHSYFVPSTLEYLTPEVKVVLLGSCGGYHNLASVLDSAPDAHIISSKQTGTQNVNEIIIKELHGNLTNGKDLNWINMWNDLDKKFEKYSATDRSYFGDYIPPNKNLGAIFIKTYRAIKAKS